MVGWFLENTLLSLAVGCSATRISKINKGEQYHNTNLLDLYDGRRYLHKLNITVIESVVSCSKVQLKSLENINFLFLIIFSFVLAVKVSLRCFLLKSVVENVIEY